MIIQLLSDSRRQLQIADYVDSTMQMALTNSVLLRIQRHLGADITVFDTSFPSFSARMLN